MEFQHLRELGIYVGIGVSILGVLKILWTQAKHEGSVGQLLKQHQDLHTEHKTTNRRHSDVLSDHDKRISLNERDIEHIKEAV